MNGSTTPDQPTRRYKSPADLTRQPACPSPSSPTTTPTTRTARITSSTTTTTTTTHHTHAPHTPVRRTSPYLPTRTELALLALYPTLLLFGALYALLSPETRAAAPSYDRTAHAHLPAEEAPSYFARKDNLLNVLFVKRGWAWVTGAFVLFVVTHPSFAVRGDGGRARVRAAVRWAVVTGWWVAVTQWCFGPAIIDRGFRWSGGRCETAEEVVMAGEGDVKDVVTAAACKASGGSWSGGHDISGHVFLLVLGSFFLVQEVGWVAARWARYVREERCVVMHDGAVKGAAVEAERRERRGEETAEMTVLDALGHGGRVAAAVVGLSTWMLLMTAIYFHTWFEKLTGLLVALAGLYVIYILPRWVPVVRRVVGLPGI